MSLKDSQNNNTLNSDTIKTIQSSTNAIIIKVCIIAALAGLLFGVDVAFVNGVLPFIERDFHLSLNDQGAVAGYLLLGAAVGALMSGYLSRLFGRKKILILAAFIFTFVTILAVLSTSFTVFLIARFIVGIAVGIASFIAPLYLSEIAPFAFRGRLVAIFQLMITIGIFVMFLSNAALMHTGSWRIMMLVIVIPSSLMLIGSFSLPESPRWMVLQDRINEARNILLHIRSSKEEAEFELNEIIATANKKSLNVKLLSNKFFIKVVILGVMLQILQQFTGINAVMYYSSQIFATAGFTNPSLATVIVGLVNMLTTIVAMKYIDNIGRKPILYFGLILMVISCMIIAYLFNLQTSGMVLSAFMQYTLLIACLVFIFGFAVSLGPIVWILCSEIFPLDGRELGVTITTMVNWMCNAIIGAYSLNWFHTFGVGNTFFLFGICGILGLGLVKFFTPETKGITLEELENNLYADIPLKKLGDLR